MNDKPRMIIRPAEPEDAAATRAVRWAMGWTDGPQRHAHWPEADAEWVAGRYYKELVAEVDGILAARVGVEAYRPPFAEIIDLSVRADFRRQGIGEAITRACEREAARRGFIGVFLQTELDNLNAHRLYTRLGFVPTAHGAMLRMLKFLDYPLLSDFRRDHPLNRYLCSPVPGRDRMWSLDWDAYVSHDYLRLFLEGGASLSESDGVGPALTGLDWSINDGGQGLEIRFDLEPAQDVEPGDYLAYTITLRNTGKRSESGVFQMILPQGVDVCASGGDSRVFGWDVEPGEEIRQPVEVRIDPTFDNSALWYLNYKSLPVSMETWWEGRRALLSSSVPMAAPAPPDS